MKANNDMDATSALHALMHYALEQGLCAAADEYVARHRLLAVLGLDAWQTVAADAVPSIAVEQVQAVLDVLTTDAAARGVIPNDGVTQRDLLDTAIMGCLVASPSVVQAEFLAQQASSPRSATDGFYRLARASNYIRTARVANNRRWRHACAYGELDITINLSKPEKDPHAIIAEKKRISHDYPLCLLCRENEGYAGRIDHPARQNLRLIPLTLNGERWFLQYSPYEYYNEHCIVLKAEHQPMRIERATFARLLDFVAQFPHYFIGSNADLPIVGGSILSHDHFQGGRYEFAMTRAAVERNWDWQRYGITVHTLNWAMSVVRLRGRDAVALANAADEVLTAWRGYSDHERGILAHSVGQDNIPHNTVTPIARMRDGVFELDLVLRNNRTDAAHPLGIFHPHAPLHHIKKENIGLIEVMGLAVLPDRLDGAVRGLAQCLRGEDEIDQHPEWAVHADWLRAIVPQYQAGSDAETFLQHAIGEVFVAVLHDAAVFKRDSLGQAGLTRFIETVLTQKS